MRLTQSQFAPVDITPDFWIVPSWHEPPAGAAGDSSGPLAWRFGTGTHPTTRMCLRWIAAPEGMPSPLGRVLDYGCGSAFWPLVRPSSAPRTSMRWTSTRRPWSPQRSMRRPMACSCAGAARSGPGQLPGLVLANILATPLRRCWPAAAVQPWAGRAPGAGGHSGAPGRRLMQAYAPGSAHGGRPGRRLDPDDRPALTRHSAEGDEPALQSTAHEPDHPLPSCGTLFKVVADQLRISDGWVRWVELPAGV